MTKFQWQIQAAIWRALVKPIPTCFLQEAMTGREGVAVRRLGVDEKISVSAVGPCVLTVNID